MDAIRKATNRRQRGQVHLIAVKQGSGGSQIRSLPLHRLTDITDNLGDTIHYTLDGAGNRTQEDTKDPSANLKRSVVRQFNALGNSTRR